VKNNGPKRTALLSRDHTLIVAPSGLVTVTGGKWTTYRKMAEDAIDNAIFATKQGKKTCVTKTLQIGNARERSQLIERIISVDPLLAGPVHPGMPYLMADIVYAIRYEMAITVEDILARRLRLLFLDAAAAMEVAGPVTALMAKELGKDKKWENEQVDSFNELAKQYLLS
jgi:glycerol-3-phosphate dehydrogenase